MRMRNTHYNASTVHDDDSSKLLTCVWKHVGRRSYPESRRPQVRDRWAGVNHQRQRKCQHPTESLVAFLATRHIASKHRSPTTVDFSEVRQLCKGIRIAKGNKVDAMSSKGREDCKDSCLLATTGTTSRDKHASGLTLQLSLLPELASGVPEGLQKERVPARSIQKER
jgi:hypothetical protein